MKLSSHMVTPLAQSYASCRQCLGEALGLLAAEGWVRMLRIRYSRQERLGHVRTTMPLARAVLQGSPAWHSPWVHKPCSSNSRR